MNQPPIVPRAEWESALEEIRREEKAQTRARDALAAKRRRLPMVAIENGYTLEGESGRLSFPALFEGRRQLLLYHFMFAPDVGGWPEAGCPGCSMFVDQIGHLAHLHARDVSFALVSRGPLEKLLEYRQRMGWSLPWYSSAGTTFNEDFGVTRPEGETFGLSAFWRNGDAVFQTYHTSQRGVEALGSVWTFLDLLPLGRQEDWEETPADRPQTPPYEWWKRHDEYPKAR